MKEKIEGVVVYPYADVYLIRVFRHANGTNLTKYRDYISKFSNAEKSRSRVSRFLYMVNSVQTKLVEERIAKNARNSKS